MATVGGPHVGGGDLRDLHHDDYQGVVGSGYSRSDFADALAAVDAAWAGFERGYILEPLRTKLEAGWFRPFDVNQN